MPDDPHIPTSGAARARQRDAESTDVLIGVRQWLRIHLRDPKRHEGAPSMRAIIEVITAHLDGPEREAHDGAKEDR